MQYPPHKSPTLVNRYYPVIRKALDKFPEPYWFKPTEGNSFNTVVARLRDTRRALVEYTYPGIRFNLDERENLERFIVSVKTDYIGVGTRSALRDTGPVMQETMVNNNDRQLPLGEVSQLVLDAACTLLAHGFFDGITVSNLDNLNLGEGFEHMNLGKETLIYVE